MKSTQLVHQALLQEWVANEYSGAADPLFRKIGNRMSGIGNRRVTSLLV